MKVSLFSSIAVVVFLFVLSMIHSVSASTLAGMNCAPDIRPVLLNAYEQGQNLRRVIVEDYYEGLFGLEQFISENLGFEYFSKNRSKIIGWASNFGLTQALEKAANETISDKKIRRQVTSKFTQTNRISSLQGVFQQSLTDLITALRAPDGNGSYLYATHVRQQGARVENQRLLATHGMAPLNFYEKSFYSKIFRIRIYSPSKRGLFGGNRDSWLGDLEVDYQCNGQLMKYSRQLNRVLKRGESMDIELPGIADSASVRLSFGCKPEHAGKAELFVEIFAPALVDNIDSPHRELLNAIRNFSLPSRGKPEVREASLKSLLSLLSRTAFQSFDGGATAYVVEIPGTPQQNGMAGGFPNGLPNGSPAGSSAGTQVGSGVAADAIQYYFYMLGDPSVTRENLQLKFRELFMTN
ncbi:MAG: hypothetical protein CVV64_11900 [Candidatus Wallbacteria bacterium HGW-Wallbacteria-1]|jgi:hypothetical protein|uniref:Uncharacterized protein n=1 Tax=Candidatus Wallbacteria bacterium HGW-Wallbacteria-1 TaxID=2013854 RepID=A0A2N1PNV4_9BACT|nr:MAG: hypothetical protein CVV64_11900 [Candidatus Wallbacteria bacterium HGW-Wallbacteria-1]